MHNQVPSDPFQQPGTPDAAPQPYVPPQFDPTAAPGSGLPAQPDPTAPQDPYSSTPPPPFSPAAPPPFSPAPPPYFGGNPPPPFSQVGPPPYAKSDFPPPPYGPPPAYPHQMYPPPTMLPGTNGFAIGALIASLCGGLGLGTALGIGFGITALVQIKRRPQNGKGLAIAALVISGLTLIATIGLFTAAFIDGMRDEAAGIEDVRSTELKTGDCIKDVNESSAVYDLPVVDCTTPHAAEVFYVFEFPAGSFPGQTAVEEQSEEKCFAAFEQYDTPENESLDIYYLYPVDSRDWLEDRGVTCVAVDPAGARTTPIIK